MDNKTGGAIGLFLIVAGLFWTAVHFTLSNDIGPSIGLILLGVILFIVFRDNKDEIKNHNNHNFKRGKQELNETSTEKEVSNMSLEEKASKEFQEKSKLPKPDKSLNHEEINKEAMALFDKKLKSK